MHPVAAHGGDQLTDAPNRLHAARRTAEVRSAQQRSRPQHAAARHELKGRTVHIGEAPAVLPLPQNLADPQLRQHRLAPGVAPAEMLVDGANRPLRQHVGSADARVTNLCQCLHQLREHLLQPLTPLLLTHLHRVVARVNGAQPYIVLALHRRAHLQQAAAAGTHAVGAVADAHLHLVVVVSEGLQHRVIGVTTTATHCVPIEVIFVCSHQLRLQLQRLLALAVATLQERLEFLQLLHLRLVKLLIKLSHTVLEGAHHLLVARRQPRAQP
ncbi:hypothetical protein DQ04_20441000 [Trypanosoma grayi]|uniref:hypothetical protein n=1 Tax=Trypanosoma grayi TaxID=71804 RepID=UPI0004F44F55|nr:hypothetical protein DQ04_20441000 [Trypanosoma grayi]KEG05565.1 hypothetical protein DQ04_20441000 [Trypanosoma grayi]